MCNFFSKTTGALMTLSFPQTLPLFLSSDFFLQWRDLVPATLRPTLPPVDWRPSGRIERVPFGGDRTAPNAALECVPRPSFYSRLSRLTLRSGGCRPDVSCTCITSVALCHSRVIHNGYYTRYTMLMLVRWFFFAG